MWFYLTTLAWPVFAFFYLVFDEPSPVLLVPLAASLLCCPISFYFFIVKLWEEIPTDIARTTPKKAAWYSFIPIFNLYWWFVAFHGLAKDMNKTALRYGKNDVIYSKDVWTACIMWAVVCILAPVAGLFYMSEFVIEESFGALHISGMLSFVVVVVLGIFIGPFVTFVVMRDILNGMNRLIAIKGNEELPSFDCKSEIIPKKGERIRFVLTCVFVTACFASLKLCTWPQLVGLYIALLVISWSYRLGHNLLVT